MKARYVPSTLVAAIIIGLAVSAAFAIGPPPFMDGAFCGYPGNDEGQGRVASGGESGLDGSLTCLTYDRVAEASGSLAEAETGNVQGFEFSVSTGISGFAPSHTFAGPMDCSEKACVGVFPFSGFVGEADFSPLLNSPVLSACGMDLAGWVCFFWAWCLAGFGFVASVSVFGLLTFCVSLVSAVALCVKCFKRGNGTNRTQHPFSPFFLYSV